MFLKHAIKEYEFDCKARKLGVNTIQGYMRMLRYLMDYLHNDLKAKHDGFLDGCHFHHLVLMKKGIVLMG